MNLPLVSVLIPVYNSGEYISESLNSVLNQTWENVEIIIVDDGSIDNSYTVAKAFESEKVRVFKQENKGACAARNFAFSVSNGEFIQYLDADDLLSPDKIEKQLYLISNTPKSVASCTWGRFYDSITDFKPEVKVVNKDYEKPVEWLIDSWSGRGAAQTSVWLTPREIISAAGGWNEELSLNQDGEFFARVLLQTETIKFCPSVFVYYRSGNKNSISKINNSEGKAESLLKSFESYKKVVMQKYDSPMIRAALAINFCNFIYMYSPAYPHLVERACLQLKNLSVNCRTSMGGPLFKVLVKLFGFFKALKLRNLLR
ncbi:glycosyltransferase family 2 protein [Pontibacter qinzhouensis]|uniref:Glycosyltransferase family 2 protein n=1 Tax=Pontibacter qinzhouensis TaxID=2603253 RepID=A0A5C8K951_9BACT|nr:glycosyltransferase [Pontibacter qinzhouensis]TXK46970.1 glycosyltransferase family 2 protein [Pontibacter qinzhouensis]